jgi:hypothetical protein
MAEVPQVAMVRLATSIQQQALLPSYTGCRLTMPHRRGSRFKAHRTGFD